MKVTIADSLGWCFGVRDAVALALGAEHRGDLTILGELVHNPVVLSELDQAGIRTVRGVDEPAATHHVMITAHGAAERSIAQLKERGHHVLDATCPLVSHAHRCLMRLAAEGYFPVVIGRADHIEVRGLVGDLDDYAVVLRREDFAALGGRPRLGVIAQTTQPLEQVLELVRALRAEFPAVEVRFVDTVCRPTKERQLAARRLAAQVDVMVVTGGRHSNNTAQLARACEAEGAVTYQVEDAADLRPEWFRGADHVGVTAGTSTPDATIEEVVAALRELGGWEDAAWRGPAREAELVGAAS